MTRCTAHGLDDCLTCALTRYAEAQLAALLRALLAPSPRFDLPRSSPRPRQPARPRAIA